MARVVTVLAATLLFALVGLLIGYLAIKANMPFAERSGTSINGGDLFMYLVVAPVAGGAIGFALAISTVMMLAPDKSSSQEMRIK